jgi:hypothetical protein
VLSVAAEIGIEGFRLVPDVFPSPIVATRIATQLIAVHQCITRSARTLKDFNGATIAALISGRHETLKESKRPGII